MNYFQKAYNETRRFERLVNYLAKDEDIQCLASIVNVLAHHNSIQTHCMALVNAIVNVPSAAETRIQLRQEFLLLGLWDVLQVRIAYHAKC
jgi:hypothetical protein